MTTYAITATDARRILTPAQYAAIEAGESHALTRAEVERTWTAYDSDEDATEALAAAGGGWVIDEDGDTTWVGPETTDDQIRALAREAAEAGDLAQVAICAAALGLPQYRVVAVLPDGQAMGDEAHVGEYAGRTFVDVIEANAAVIALDGDRPEGHEDVRYEARRDETDAEWARAECARVIADARAQQD